MTYNIRLNKPFKYDTKVEDFNPKNMDDAVNIWITSHILLYDIKAWNKVYDLMHTVKSDVNSYIVHVSEVFTTKYFIHKICTLLE